MDEGRRSLSSRGACCLTQGSIMLLYSPRCWKVLPYLVLKFISLWGPPIIPLAVLRTTHCPFLSASHSSSRIQSSFHVQFSRSVMSDSLRPHELQHARPPCPSQTPGAYSNSCPLSWWCHPAISSSVVPFSSCPQSLPPSGSFPMSQLFAWGSQSIGVSASASVLPINTQDLSPSGWTGWISLQSMLRGLK